MRYVVGDIHGEFHKLQSLIEKIVTGCKEIIFVGDYIGKGQYSKEVIDYLIYLDSKMDCIFLKGNHELMLLRALKNDKKSLDFLEKYGDKETLKSYLKTNYTQNFEVNIELFFRKISIQHLNFLKNLRPYYEDEKYIIVHAGINPENNNRSYEDQYFIRYKFIKHKFSILDKRIIFGHTAFMTPYFDPYKVGIDTGAAYLEYGNLTAYNLDKGYCINHSGQIINDPYFNVVEMI